MGGKVNVRPPLFLFPPPSLPPLRWRRGGRNGGSVKRTGFFLLLFPLPSPSPPFSPPPGRLRSRLPPQPGETGWVMSPPPLSPFPPPSPFPLPFTTRRRQRRPEDALSPPPPRFFCSPSSGAAAGPGVVNERRLKPQPPTAHLFFFPLSFSPFPFFPPFLSHDRMQASQSAPAGQEL